MKFLAIVCCILGMCAADAMARTVAPENECGQPVKRDVLLSASAVRQKVDHQVSEPEGLPSAVHDLKARPIHGRMPEMTVVNPDGSYTSFIRGKTKILAGHGKADNTLDTVGAYGYPPTGTDVYMAAIGNVTGLGELRLAASFDVYYFPDDAVVTQVQSIINVFRYTGYSAGNLSLAYHHMTLDTIFGDTAAVYADCADGTLYANCTQADPGATVTRVITNLGAQAAADFQAAVAGTGDFWSWGADWTGGTNVAYGANSCQSMADDPVIAVTFTSATANPPEITGAWVTPSTMYALGPSTFTLNTMWVDPDTHTIDDFYLLAMIRSSVGTMYDLGLPTTITQRDAHTWEASWTNVDIRTTIENGTYDLEVGVIDGVYYDIHRFAENADELQVLRHSRVITYEDWNNNHSVPPLGWTITTTAGNPWSTDYVYECTEDYIIVADSGALLPSADTTTILSTGNINCTSATNVRLNFYSEFSAAGAAMGYVELSTNGGVSWLPMLTFSASEGGDYDIALPGAAGLNNARVRFRFEAPAGANTWMLDVVQVYNAPASPVATNGATTCSPHAPTGVDILTNQTITFSGTFADSDSLSTDDFRLTVLIRSAQDREWSAAVAAKRGDPGVTVTATSPGQFSWQIANVEVDPIVATGLYDLQLDLTDGWTSDTDEYANNSNELSLTAASAALYQDFNTTGGTTPPTGWAIVHGAGHAATEDWTFDWSWTGTTDYLAGIMYETGLQQDTYLVSPVFSCASATTVYFYYFTEWATGYDPLAVGEFQYSLDGGTTWDWMIQYSYDAGSGSEVGWWDVSGIFAGESNCRLRMWYFANDDNYWIVDPVIIYPTNPPTPAPTPTPSPTPTLGPVPAVGDVGLVILVVALGIILMRRAAR